MQSLIVPEQAALGKKYSNTFHQNQPSMNTIELGNATERGSEFMTPCEKKFVFKQVELPKLPQESSIASE